MVYKQKNNTLSIGMKPFGEAQSKVMRTYAQSGQYHTIVESRVLTIRTSPLTLKLISLSLSLGCYFLSMYQSESGRAEVQKCTKDASFLSEMQQCQSSKSMDLCTRKQPQHWWHSCHGHTNHSHPKLSYNDW